MELTVRRHDDRSPIYSKRSNMVPFLSDSHELTHSVLIGDGGDDNAGQKRITIVQAAAHNAWTRACVASGFSD